MNDGRVEEKSKLLEVQRGVGGVMLFCDLIQ